MSTRLLVAFVAYTVIKHHGCKGRIYNKAFSISSNQIVQSEKLHGSRFGFEEGGTLSWNLSCACLHPCQGEKLLGSVKLLLCESQVEKKVDKAEQSELCNAVFDCRTNPARQIQNQESISWIVNESIEKSSFYTSYMLKCGGNETGAGFTCKSHLILLNPGGEHLSYDEIPLPPMYFTGITLWSGLLVLWLINWAVYWKYSNSLHRLLFLAPFFKAVVHLVLYFRWEMISHTGYDSNLLTTLNYLTRSMQEALLFLLIMLVSDGWHVTRVSTTIYRWLGMAMLFFGLLASLLCFELVHQYFLAFAVCCCLFMLYKTLKWATSNVDSLVKQQRQISSYVVRLGLTYITEYTVDDLLFAKTRLYRRYRTFCISWAVASVLGITAVLFLTEETWLRILSVEVPEAVIISGILVLFRLQCFEPYQNIKLKAPETNFIVILGPATDDDYRAVYMAEETCHIGSRKNSRSGSRKRNSRYVVETSV